MSRYKASHSFKQMELTHILSLLTITLTAAANPVLDPRGGVPCNFYNPASEPCPPQWPRCIKFPSSCQSNCAGICV
ncbi:hypothetical protein OQA88_5170 [Cercophora sp. LCS_1]